MVSFRQVSPPKPCIDLSVILATCPVHLPDFITRTILGEEYRSLSSMTIACEILIVRNEEKRPHSRYCGVLLKIYLEVGVTECVLNLVQGGVLYPLSGPNIA